MSDSPGLTALKTNGTHITVVGSVCSLSAGGEPLESPRSACHCCQNVEVDESSNVFNGDMVDGMQPANLQNHHMLGGSVEGNSRVVDSELN